MSKGVSEFESRSVPEGRCKLDGKHFPLGWHWKRKLLYVYEMLDA